MFNKSKKRKFLSFKNHFLVVGEWSGIGSLIDEMEVLFKQRLNIKKSILSLNKKNDGGIKNKVFPLFPRPRKEVMKEVIDAFEGIIQWSSPFVMHNITPPVLKDTIVVRSLVSAYNPNCLWNFVSGNILEYERQIGRQIAKLFKWNEEKAGIVFTFGGKATILYAIKAGINRCNRESVTKGLSGNTFVITSSNTHYSIEYACVLLGIGKNNCIRIPNNDEGIIDLEELKKKDNTSS